MANIAVYEKFYQSGQPYDTVGLAFAELEHAPRIVGAATNLRDAAAQIISFVDQPVADQPDLIVMGGMLYDEHAYCADPLRVAGPGTVRKRSLLGGFREIPAHRTTFLLPQFSEDGSAYHFPEIVSPRKPKEPPQELLEQWQPSPNIAASVLSRIVETHLPRAKRVGISDNPMFDAVLHAEVLRGSDAVRQLCCHIRQLTGGF